MKNNEQMSGEESANQARELMKACKVAELRACKRAGMATSTLLRWHRGSSPKDGQLDILTRAILEVAAEQGSLPEDRQSELERLRQVVELPVSQESELKVRVDRLERVVTEQLGGQL